MHTRKNNRDDRDQEGDTTLPKRQNSSKRSRAEVDQLMPPTKIVLGTGMEAEVDAFIPDGDMGSDMGAPVPPPLCSPSQSSFPNVTAR